MYQVVLTPLGGGGGGEEERKGIIVCTDPVQRT